MDKTKAIRLSVEEQLAMEHIEKMKQDEEWDAEGTFQYKGGKYYNYISEDRIREIIREEIVQYNEVFMKALTKEKDESVTN
jgi:hypothetical protein|tara:strand:- start:545 stop:787 length:243 start_codon:yes stop_codon:yes gene_type:complete